MKISRNLLNQIIRKLSLNSKRLDLAFDRFYRTKLLERAGKSIRITSPTETLDEISRLILSKRGGAYLRFGDGDVFLLNGRPDRLQIWSEGLSQELLESFCMTGPTVIKGLAIHSERFGKELEMTKGNHLLADDFAFKLLADSFEFFIGNRIYSPVALHYVASVNPEEAKEFLDMLKRNCLMFIGNETIKPAVIRSLFGDVIHVETPSENAYSNIDEIENEAAETLNEKSGFGVIVVAMGCATRAIIKRLHKRFPEKFFFDFGSLIDGLNGELSREWLRISNVNKDILLADESS